jgi:hypothetical protein
VPVACNTGTPRIASRQADKVPRRFLGTLWPDRTPWLVGRKKPRPSPSEAGSGCGDPAASIGHRVQQLVRGGCRCCPSCCPLCCPSRGHTAAAVAALEQAVRCARNEPERKQIAAEISRLTRKKEVWSQARRSRPVRLPRSTSGAVAAKIGTDERRPPRSRR